MTRRFLRRVAPLALALGVLSTASAGVADASPVEPSPPTEPRRSSSAPAESCSGPRPVDAQGLARVERARRHHARALVFHDAGDHEAALREFERAYALSPAYQLLFNLGQLEYRLGRHGRARQHLAAYLRLGGSCIAAERRAEVAAELASLAESGAEQTRPGVSALKARDPAHDPKATVAWVSAGVLGVGALATGVGTLLAARRQDELRSEPALEGEAASARARLERQRALVQTLSLATDVLAVAALGAAALGLYWTLSSDGEQPGAPLALDLGPRGMRLSGSF